MKYIVYTLFVCLFPKIAYAQWTEADSLHLQDLLSGREKIRLNPEFQRSIENGTFLSTDRPTEPMISSPLQLPITSDFSEYIQCDTFRLKVNSDSITPAAYLLQNFKSPASLSVRKQAYTSANPLIRNGEIRFGKLPVYGKITTGNLFLEDVKDGQHRGGFLATIRINFSAEDILETIFWKSARAKKRNRKRENTWKFYNDYP